MSLSETVKRIQAPTFIHFHHSCSLLPGLRLELKAHIAGTKRKLSGGRRSKKRHPIKSAELSVSEEAFSAFWELSSLWFYTPPVRSLDTPSMIFFFLHLYHFLYCWCRQQIHVQDTWNYQANIFFDNSVKTATLQFNHSQFRWLQWESAM